MRLAGLSSGYNGAVLAATAAPNDRNARSSVLLRSRAATDLYQPPYRLTCAQVRRAMESIRSGSPIRNSQASLQAAMIAS